jgi:hypothetical protein
MFLFFLKLRGAQPSESFSGINSRGVCFVSPIFFFFSFSVALFIESNNQRESLPDNNNKKSLRFSGGGGLQELSFSGVIN